MIYPIKSHHESAVLGLHQETKPILITMNRSQSWLATINHSIDHISLLYINHSINHAFLSDCADIGDGLSLGLLHGSLRCPSGKVHKPLVETTYNIYHTTSKTINKNEHYESSVVPLPQSLVIPSNDCTYVYMYFIYIYIYTQLYIYIHTHIWTTLNPY